MSVKDFQVFLGFANLYRRFIKNFNRITASLTSMLRTMIIATEADSLSTKAKDDKYKKEERDGSRAGRVDRVGSGNKILSTNAKSKNSPKSKRKSDFVKSNSFKTDFFTPRAKEAFTYQRKAITEAPIFVILAQKVISGLKRILQALLLMELLAK